MLEATARGLHIASPNGRNDEWPRIATLRAPNTRAAGACTPELSLQRLRAVWIGIRDSLWFLPGLLTLAAAALAFFTVALDRRYVRGRTADPWWLFGAGVEGAREVLSGIATSVITVTGVVFSMTVIVLQLASTQYTPRLLRYFSSDRANQVVMGIFIATFTYALLVLRTVRSEFEEGADAFIPYISLTVAVTLALLSIAALIFFIDHLARSMRASVILNGVAQDTRRTVENVFGAEQPEVERVASDEPPEQTAAVLSDAYGYLQVVDRGALEKLGSHGVRGVQLAVDIGDFISEGQVVAGLWPVEAGTQDVVSEASRAFIVGRERTLDLDPELGIVELSDVAIKALSPGINDPTTAMIAIDRLGEVLLHFVRLDENGQRWIPLGNGVALWRRARGFERLLATAFQQVRYYGRNDVKVSGRLAETLGKIGASTRGERRPVVIRHLEALRDSARDSLTTSMDVETVEMAIRNALVAMQEGRRDEAGERAVPGMEIA